MEEIAMAVSRNKREGKFLIERTAQKPQQPNRRGRKSIQRYHTVITNARRWDFFGVSD
jgi:hypothetical protein